MLRGTNLTLADAIQQHVNCLHGATRNITGLVCRSLQE